jgi:hypothetical protein
LKKMAQNMNLIIEQNYGMLFQFHHRNLEPSYNSDWAPSPHSEMEGNNRTRRGEQPTKTTITRNIPMTQK